MELYELQMGRTPSFLRSCNYIPEFVNLKIFERAIEPIFLDANTV